MAIIALNLGIVTRLWAFARGVAHLFTVATLHVGHIFWLSTFFGGVTILLAVVAFHNARLVAFGALVAFLSAVAACHWTTTSRAVP